MHFVWRVGEGMRLGTASPLTPALSPLRGEGGARGTSLGQDASTRAAIASRFDCAAKKGFPTEVAVRRHEQRGASVSARSIDALPTRSSAFESNRARCASPSPLNGERAGVRGEAVRLASLSRSPSNSSPPCQKAFLGRPAVKTPKLAHEPGPVSHTLGGRRFGRNEGFALAGRRGQLRERALGSTGTFPG